MHISLAFDDSEVQRVDASGRTLSVLFSAAHVQRTIEVVPVEGYLQALEMVFTTATWTGPLHESLGRLRDGWVRLEGVPQRRFALPFAHTGTVQAELSFRNGSLLTVSAGSLALKVGGELRFVESFAC